MFHTVAACMGDWLAFAETIEILLFLWLKHGDIDYIL